MIFNPETVCMPVFCTEWAEEAGHNCKLPRAELSIVLVSSGKAAVTVQSQVLLVEAGAVLLVRGEAEITPSTSLHLLAVGLAGSAVCTIAQGLEKPVVSDAAVCPQMGQAMGELFASYQVARSGAAAGVWPNTTEQEPLTAYAPVLSALAYRVLCAAAQADTKAPALPPLVAQAVLAMRENYAGLYGVEELSVQLGVSKSHLVRLFSSAMGIPPGQYLTRVRVAAAKQLLLHREYTLDIVASLCGFSGANYLCKVFKKETGITPAAYRLQNMGRAGAGQSQSELERALYM